MEYPKLLGMSVLTLVNACHSPLQPAPSRCPSKTAKVGDYQWGNGEARFSSHQDPISDSVTSGQSFPMSGPQFPHLYNED